MDTLSLNRKELNLEERKLKETEEAVLNTYQKVNPSTHSIEKEEVLKEHTHIRENLFRDKLKFPPEMFKDKNILDFGSGTGENCSFYLRWGGKKLTCVEINRLAIERLNKLYSEWGIDKKTKVYNCSLFDFDSGGERFDIVTCDGILNHVEYPEWGFKKLVSNLTERGYVIISMGNTSGAFQRNLQKYSLYKLSNNNTEELIRLAKLLFPEHIERASRFGRRTPEAVIYDTFINPKTTNVSVSEVLRWFDENGISFYSSWPPLQFPFAFVDSVNQPPIHFENPEYRDLFAFPELFWLAADKYDMEIIKENREKLISLSELKPAMDKIKDVTPEFALKFDLNDFLKQIRDTGLRIIKESLQKENSKNLSLFFSEVLDFLETLNSSNDLELFQKKIGEYKMLFKGYCGLGEVFYVGYKREKNEHAN